MALRQTAANGQHLHQLHLQHTGSSSKQPPTFNGNQMQGSNHVMGIQPIQLQMLLFKEERMGATTTTIRLTERRDVERKAKAESWAEGVHPSGRG
ncbi:hypothetical protein ACLOJK_029356 [Asimina triloba]